jgi:hypothetical protein
MVDDEELAARESERMPSDAAIDVP